MSVIVPSFFELLPDFFSCVSDTVTEAPTIGS